MRCQAQPNFLKHRPIQITDIWEVHLPLSTWRSIRQLAKKRNRSFSTVTRYCIFRLAEKASLRWFGKLQKAQKEIRENLACSEILHRHMVCLYGEDVMLLRIAALKLRITVSAFIRLSLQLFLPRLATDFHNCQKVSDKELFWCGIKRWQTVPISALNIQKVPHIRIFAFGGFFPWQWWGTEGYDSS